MSKKMTDRIKAALETRDGDGIRFKYSGCTVEITDGYGERAYDDTYAWFYWIDVCASIGKVYSMEKYEDDNRLIQLELLKDDELHILASMALSVVAEVRSKVERR